MIPAMEVTDRPLLALVPILAACVAVVVVAIVQGADAAVVAAVGCASSPQPANSRQASRTAAVLRVELTADPGQ